MVRYFTILVLYKWWIGVFVAGENAACYNSYRSDKNTPNLLALIFPFAGSNPSHE
jgi:hypothetical protein